MHTFILQENGAELERVSKSEFESVEAAQEKLDEFEQKYKDRIVSHFEWIYPNGKGPKFVNAFTDLNPDEDCEDIVVVHLEPES